MSAMAGFHRTSEGLLCEGASLAIIARQFGTPSYVYSLGVIDRQLERLASAFRGINLLPCYAAKANNNPDILRRIASRKDLAWGMDAVSAGELRAGITAGFRPGNLIFSGVGKQDPELEFAISRDIAINVESLFELEAIAAAAKKLGRRARIGLRFNPDVDAGTHPKITTGTKRNKFGLPSSALDAILGRIAMEPATVKLCGVSTHIGSQIRDLRAWQTSACQLVKLAESLLEKGFNEIEFIDFGGGFPVRYDGEQEPPAMDEFAAIIRDALADATNEVVRNLLVIIEPGRWVVAESGGLLTRVIGVKDQFIVVDASMTELIRPALYDARHEIIFDAGPEGTQESPSSSHNFDVVGPVCESSDVLAWDITPGFPPKKNQLAVILQAGAYGFSMASTYNLRPLPPEILVEGNSVALSRPSSK
jgi:diaminopimelate decarboxylase